jgi:formylmethanofuran dehydrogenase subunit E
MSETYYDRNFGHWNMSEGQKMVDFYHKVQKESEEKNCQQCGERVLLRRNYVICSDCADRNEWF